MVLVRDWHSTEYKAYIPISNSNSFRISPPPSGDPKSQVKSDRRDRVELCCSCISGIRSAKYVHTYRTLYEVPVGAATQSVILTE